jgi:hypothetical protein
MPKQWQELVASQDIENSAEPNVVSHNGEEIFPMEN